MSVQTVKILNLEGPLLHGTVSSRYDIARLEKIARTDPSNLPNVLVGTVGKKHYPMGRFDVLAACRAAKMQDVKADVRDYDSELDLMTEQVREISSGEYMDPLRIRHVIGAFEKHGLEADDVLDAVNLAETPAARIAMSLITDDVLKALSDFVSNELSDKLPAASLVVPAHIILRIAKMDPEMQSVVARRVTELTIPQQDMNFAWPPPLSVAYEIRNMPKPEKKSDAVVVKVAGADGAGGKEAAACPAGACGVKPEARPEAAKIPEEYASVVEDLQAVSSNCMIVLDAKGKPDLLVDAKNHTAKRISDVDGSRAFKLHADASRPAFMIPVRSANHLALESRSMHGRDFDGAKPLADFCRTLKGPGLRATVFWTTE